MRSNPTVRLLLAASLAASFAAGSASADLIHYSWSGRVEPRGDLNPWFLSGDGSAVTPDDGTAFTLEAVVDVGAIDEDGTLNPDFARYVPEYVTLIIGGADAVVTSPEVVLSDDAFDGSFDSIGLDTEAEMLGTSLSFSADVRLDAATFALASPPAPDPAPLFAATLPIQFGGSGSAQLVTLPQNAAVTGSLEVCGGASIPEPVSWTTPTAGTAAGIDVAIEGIAPAEFERFELKGPAFAAAEQCSSAQLVSYPTSADWTLTLSAPAGTVLLYAKFWRGPGVDVDPVSYQFDAPFTILSGLAEADVGNGNTLLSLGASSFHDGILQFDGPITSLGVEVDSTAIGQQAMTFALVPEPGAVSGALASLAALLLVRQRYA